MDGTNAIRGDRYGQAGASGGGAADGLVTKPGGLTVAEALTVGVPLFLFDPLPGPEEENARFLL
ncbi:hypothetical protein AB1398_05455, partial [Hydrogenibacillus schlegelii]